MFPATENRGYNKAILIGIVLEPSYIFRLCNENIIDYYQFSEKEKAADSLAEWTADFIEARGYKAYAQSEKNLALHGFYEETTKTTPLPHKKIALLAGIGWIGKSNLLVTQEYGSAICMCTVLTNATLPTENKPIIKPKCGDCTVCKDICPTGVIRGATWEIAMNRDLIVNVYHCETCLKCLANCPWTLKYEKGDISAT